MWIALSTADNVLFCGSRTEIEVGKGCRGGYRTRDSYHGSWLPITESEWSKGHKLWMSVWNPQIKSLAVFGSCIWVLHSPKQTYIEPQKKHSLHLAASQISYEELDSTHQNPSKGYCSLCETFTQVLGKLYLFPKIFFFSWYFLSL